MNKLIKTMLVTSTVILGLFFVACNNIQNKSSDIENTQHQHSDSIYACPMHPKETGKKSDKCSKCGMDLQLVTVDKTNNVEVRITATPETIEAEKPTELSFSINEDGKSVVLDVVHEKKIHLLVVNDELTWFSHIHPEEQSDGNYTVTETFPNGGKYILFTDFKVSGAPATVNKKELKVSGKAVENLKTVSEKWVSNVDELTVTLVNGNDFKTNRPQHLGITIKQNGKYIIGKEIEPYLGAVAHIIVIGKTDKDFLHVHPTSNEKYPIHGETRFEKAGAYRMWVQFQLNGKVHTADFTINVSEGKEIIESETHNHSQHQH